jgi:2,4-dienoyl-CoA reductase-like NADH-dependent reductase (Old Yellow Enzyme family)
MQLPTYQGREVPVTLSPHSSPLLQPGHVGERRVRNRIVRSSTSETLADEAGAITEGYKALHLKLARGGVGLILTGHCYVERRGKYTAGMTALDRDDLIPPLLELTSEVHKEGSLIFAQLNHAGSKSRDSTIDPVAPSVVTNPSFRRTPVKPASETDIELVIHSFGQAALRAAEAGFDGIHVHAGHGYLLSEFLSPITNHRTDHWGGSAENRARMLMEVYRAIRSAVGSRFPVTVKLGLEDFVEGGLSVTDGLRAARLLDAEGVDAIEGSAGLISPAAESARQYAGVTRKRALQDKLFHRVFSKPAPEAYFREHAKRLRSAVSCKVIIVGGLRSIEVMEDIVSSGDADFVSLARPLIREPDLVRKIEEGRIDIAACVSCNICMMHEGLHPLKCWRNSNRDLLEHALYRLAGKLN